MPSTRRRFLQATAIATAVGTAGCSTLPGAGPTLAEIPPPSVGTDWTPPPDAWVSRHRGPRRSRHAPDARGPETGTVAWHLDRSRSEYHTTLAVDAATPTIAFGHARDEAAATAVLFALDPVDGTERWRRSLAEPWGPAHLVEGTVYATAGETDIVAIAAATGERLWRTDLRSILDDALPLDRLVEDFDISRLVPTPGMVYVESAYGIHGLRPTDGQEIWRVALGNPPYHGNGLTVGHEAIYAVDLAQGRLYVLAGTESTPPAIGFDPPIRAPAMAAGRVGLSPDETARLAWSAPATALRALAAKEGADEPVASTESNGLWRAPRPEAATVRGRETAPVAADGDRFYVAETITRSATVEVCVTALEAADGEQLWRNAATVVQHSTVADLHVPPLIAPLCIGRDTVYSCAASAVTVEPAAGGLRQTATTIAALDRADGEVRWTATVPFQVRGASLAGKSLYVWDGSGRLAAVR